MASDTAQTGATKERKVPTTKTTRNPITRLRDAAIAMSLLHEAAASDPSRPPGRVKPTSSPPSGTESLFAQWCRLIERLAAEAEYAVDRHKRGVEVTPSTIRRKRIASSTLYRGMSSMEVGRIEGVDSRNVRQVRQRAGLDPHTGYPAAIRRDAAA